MRQFSLILIFISLILYGFDFKSGDNINKTLINITGFDNDSIKSKIFGDWGIYAYETIYLIDSIPSSRILCNVCPRIIFKDNMTAIITRPSDLKEKITWKIIGDKLIIRNFTDSIENPILANGEYQMDFTDKREFKELSLSRKETGFIHKSILRK
jgi:hypothetical protein